MTQLSESAVALVTGGTAGIGLACAAALVRAGSSKIVITGRSRERGETAVQTLKRHAAGTDIRFLAADASTVEGACASTDACVEWFGRVDTLVSCAGGAPFPRLMHETPIENVIPTISSITSGVLLPARAVLPVMMQQKSGSIVCIASDASKVATPGEVAIGAAMSAIAMFCRGLAIEAKRSGIRVNCVTPSIVKGTPFYDMLMADPFSSKLFSKAERLAGLGVVDADEVADLVAFLATPASAKVTGQTISVNGGISAA
jgi:NAD(P)-dependent dehydrogenase (short-subunit alcohol dehydrogenase family)